MSDEMEVKDGHSPEEVAALMETLRDCVNLEEGGLYILRKNQLQPVTPRDEDGGLRRIKIMDEAYEAAQMLAKRLRRKMRGYRPDPALVVSACVMDAVSHREPDEADEMVIQYLQRLFSRAEPEREPTT